MMSAAMRAATPEEQTQAKQIVGFVVDAAARVLYVQARSLLDVNVTLVAVPFSQLKHVAGQLVMQEGQAEIVGALHVLSAEGLRGNAASSPKS